MESPSHEEREPRAILTDYQLVIEAGENCCDRNEQLGRILSTFFAMRSAYLLRVRLGVGTNDQLEGAKGLAGNQGGDLDEFFFPTFLAVGNAAQKLAFALEVNDRVSIRSSLEEMGVFVLCPFPERQLSEMERLLGPVSGRPRLVFLVELALFAIELGKMDEARRYVSDAWELNPSGWELYNACMIEGLFAVDAGVLSDAVRWLEESVNACQRDEGTSLNCGLRAPNFRLVQKLFDRGERDAVLNHLANCKNIWQRSWMPMGQWISMIKSGLTPDFQGSEAIKAMNLPSCRLALQWMRACSLASEIVPVSSGMKSKSPTEVLAAREKLMERGIVLLNRRIMESISYLESKLDNAPDTETSGPEKQGEPD
jgi:hypothetical protein